MSRRAHDDTRVRVLFLQTKQQPPLGADTWVQLQLIRGLDRSRVDVHAASTAGPTGRPTPTWRELQRIPEVGFVEVDLGRELTDASARAKLVSLMSLVPASWSVVRLARYLRRERINLIHTTDRPRDAVIAVLLARLLRVTSVVHAHVTFDPRWMRRSLQWAIREADVVVAISDFVATSLRGVRRDSARVHVVRNGIDLGGWVPGEGRAKVRAELGLDEATPVVATVCRLFRAKGVTELVLALHAASDAAPDSVLLVVGDEMEPGYLAELRALADRLGLGDRVRFLGRRGDVADVMAAADVFAMPSLDEPFGLVFAEAMAMRLPVVALACGGAVEVVEDGVTGLLSPPGDDEALAANLRTLLLDPLRRDELGRRGRERVERCFTTERMVAETASLYRLASSRAELEDQPPPANLRPSSAATRGGAPVVGDPALTSQQFADALDRDGFVVMRDVVDKDALSAFRDDLLADFDALVTNGLPFEGGGLYSGHLNCFPGERSRFVYEALVAAGIVDLVRSYRPEIADAVRPTLNFNLPGSVAQHYHMDDAFLKEFLICNVAVVDTDLENGAIDVLPGTNREFHPFWRYALERLYRLTTRVPLAQGDLIVRKSTLWHRGMPNLSTTPRPMMAITFGEVEPTGDPFATNGGEIEFYANWFRTSRLGRLRERTFVTAPISYSVYRFVTSLYSKKGYESF